MSPELVSPPRRVLMTLDAVGGVWRYALDLTRSLGKQGIDVLLVGLGPPPSSDQHAELESLPSKKVFWLGEPLDWMARHESELQPLRTRLRHIVEDHGVDLVHLNVPSQANGLDVVTPVVTVSHSCVATWWRAVRRTRLSPDLDWQLECNGLGLARADLVLAPTRSHAAALVRAYGPLKSLKVVHNAAELPRPSARKEPRIFAAGRWWDEGKNGRLLDDAARHSRWPVSMAGATHGPNGESIALRHAACLGQRSTRDVLELMSQASIFAAPSLYEPFGLAVLEAALSGSALVLADIPTFRELWGGAASFADPTIPAQWTDAFNCLALNSENCTRLGRLARARAEQFSHRRQVNNVLDAYREASYLATRRAA